MSADLWVPLRTPDDHGDRAYAAQLLEMLVGYGLIDGARQDGEGFLVNGQTLSPSQVLDEYGDRLAEMATRVMEHSPLTTTRTSVPVGAACGPVPYIDDPADRTTEYQRLWPRDGKDT